MHMWIISVGRHLSRTLKKANAPAEDRTGDPSIYSLALYHVAIKAGLYRKAVQVYHIPNIYSTDQVVFQKSSPAGGAIFFAHRGLSQTSAQASSATANSPTANPPRSHRKTTQLPVEIAEGSISIAAGAYRPAGDVSMIDSLKIFRIHVSYFPSGMYERQIL